jgi:hypothetical protein
MPRQENQIQTKLSLRLGARVFDLKERGWDFRTEELPNKNTVYHVTKWPEGKYPKGERALEMHHREKVACDACVANKLLVANFETV